MSDFQTKLNRILVVFSKEVADNLRDRRSVFTGLVGALIGPALLLGMVVLMGKTVLADLRENPLRLPVSGAENAPNLVAFLEQHGVTVISAPQDPQQAVRKGQVDLVLLVPPAYGNAFESGSPATVQLIFDASRQSAARSVSQARNLLSAYERQIAAMRLSVRGIDPAITSPLAVESVDVSTPQSQAFFFLNMMPYFVVLVVFVGGMYVIVDATAGERERGSLEPLLINPATRAEFVLGKLSASIPFAIAAMTLTLLAFGLAFNLFPFDEYVGIHVQVSFLSLAGIFLVALPMVLLASSLQMIIATFTRSFKEAQTYVGFLPLIPALPGIALALLPVKPTAGNMLVPTFSQQLLINQLMRGEPLEPVYVILASGMTLLVSLVLVLVAIRLYRKEEILFGNR